jgi:hypothetical protein
MNKKLAVRNLVVAVVLVLMAVGMTLAFLGYIQFFRLLPR